MLKIWICLYKQINIVNFICSHFGGVYVQTTSFFVRHSVQDTFRIWIPEIIFWSRIRISLLDLLLLYLSFFFKYDVFYKAILWIKYGAYPESKYTQAHTDVDILFSSCRQCSLTSRSTLCNETGLKSVHYAENCRRDNTFGGKCALPWSSWTWMETIVNRREVETYLPIHIHNYKFIYL